LRKRYEKTSNPLLQWRRRPWCRVLGAAIVGVIALFAAAASYLYWAWTHPLNPGRETYLVKPGTSLRGLAQQLHERDVIVEPHSFTLLGALTGRSRKIKAGEYRFRPGLSAKEILDQVVAGRVVEYPLVVLEGWTFQQMLKAIEAAPKLTKTLTGVPPNKIMMHLGHPQLHPEGRFFPDTYYYTAGTTDLMILMRAFERMQKVLEEEWDNRDPNLPLKSMDEALVLASIIEKETGHPGERRLISGVFVNRLRRGMRLQTDPTVIYGMGAAFTGNIRLDDLRRDTPYNTYTRHGLPPTPIALPGAQSIAAAMHPEETDAIFFVSRGDGTHVFSATLEEHNRAVDQYQRRRATSPSAPVGTRAAPKPRPRAQ
jgi:UPF0755 protein